MRIMIMCCPVRTNAHLWRWWHCGAKSNRYLAGKNQTISGKKSAPMAIPFTWHHLEMKQSFHSDKQSSVHIMAQYCFSHHSKPCQDTSCYEAPHMWISRHFLAMFHQFLPEVEPVPRDELPPDGKQNTEEWRLSQIRPGRRAALELWCRHHQVLRVEEKLLHLMSLMEIVWVYLQSGIPLFPCWWGDSCQIQQYLLLILYCSIPCVLISVTQIYKTPTEAFLSLVPYIKTYVCWHYKTIISVTCNNYKNLLSILTTLVIKFVEFSHNRYSIGTNVLLKNRRRGYSKGNKTVPGKVATTHTEDGHTEDT